MNDLGYKVTKVGKIVYNRGGKPWNLKRAKNIFNAYWKIWEQTRKTDDKAGTTGYDIGDPAGILEFQSAIEDWRRKLSNILNTFIAAGTGPSI